MADFKVRVDPSLESKQRFWRNKYGEWVWWPCDADGERITDPEAIERALTEDGDQVYCDTCSKPIEGIRYNPRTTHKGGIHHRECKPNTIASTS